LTRVSLSVADYAYPKLGKDLKLVSKYMTTNSIIKAQKKNMFDCGHITILPPQELESGIPLYYYYYWMLSSLGTTFTARTEYSSVW